MTKQWHVHPVALARETQEAAGRKEEVLTDKMREENDGEWHFCGWGKKETPCSDKKKKKNFSYDD